MINELLNKLPDSWATMTIEMFLKVHNNPTIETNQDDLYYSTQADLNVIAAITDTPLEAIEGLSGLDVIPLLAKLSFMKESPIGKVSSIKWKLVEDIGYSEYVTLLRIENDLINNIPLFVSLFSKDKITKEEALQLSVEDVFTGFFLLCQKQSKSLNRLLWSTKKKWMKQVIMEKTKKLMVKMKIKTK